jgi:hypothetical protein
MIILTQDIYRLWARIGPSVSNTPGDVQVTPSNAEVAAQLALLDTDSNQII